MARQRIDPITVRKSGGQSLRTVASFAPITNVPKLNLGSEKTQKFQKAILGLKSELQTYEKIEDVKQDNRDKRAAEGQFFIDQKALATAKDHAGELDTTLSSEADIHRAAAERMNAQSYMWQTTYATLQGENAASTEIAKLNEQMAAAVASGDLEALEGMRDTYKNVRGSMFEKGKGNAFFTGGLTSKFREADQNFAGTIAKNIRDVRLKKITAELAQSASVIFNNYDNTLTERGNADKNLSEVYRRANALVATGITSKEKSREDLVGLVTSAAAASGDPRVGGHMIDALLRASQSGTLIRTDGHPLKLIDEEIRELQKQKDALIDESWNDTQRKRQVEAQATEDMTKRLKATVYTEYILKQKPIPIGLLNKLATDMTGSEEFIGTGGKVDVSEIRKWANSSRSEITKYKNSIRFTTPEAEAEHFVKAQKMVETLVLRNRQGEDAPDLNAVDEQIGESPSGGQMTAADITASVQKTMRLGLSSTKLIYTLADKLINKPEESVHAAARKIVKASEISRAFGYNLLTGKSSSASNLFDVLYSKHLNNLEESGGILPGETEKLNLKLASSGVKIHKYVLSQTIDEMWRQKGTFTDLRKGPPKATASKEVKDAWTNSRGMKFETVMSPASKWNFIKEQYVISETTPDSLRKLIEGTNETASPPSTPTTNAAAKEALNKAIAPPPVTPTTGAPPPPPPVTPASNNDLDVSGSLGDLANQVGTISENREKAIEQAVGRTEIEENRNDLSVAEMLSSVVGSGGEIVSRLKPEFIEKAAGFVNDLKSANVISNDVPLDVIQDIISKFYGAEGVFGNPDWAEEAARQIQNVSIDDGVD